MVSHRAKYSCGQWGGLGSKKFDNDCCKSFHPFILKPTWWLHSALLFLLNIPHPIVAKPVK